jgi:hypothetical protein
MNRNRCEPGGRIQPLPGLQIAIKRHDFHVVSALKQSSTDVQDTTFYSSDFGVELPCNLQYPHQGGGSGPTNEKTMSLALEQETKLPLSVLLSVAWPSKLPAPRNASRASSTVCVPITDPVGFVPRSGGQGGFAGNASADHCPDTVPSGRWVILISTLDNAPIASVVAHRPLRSTDDG